MLIITYYWPPAGGSPVLRWLKFSKYLPEFNWLPVVYTPENPVPQAYDSTLLSDIPEDFIVIKTSIREPSNRFGFKNKTGSTQSTAFISEKGKKSFLSEIAIWIRGNIFIPDARMFWINPSVSYLKKYLESEKPDAIISTGPPHSMHRIAYKLKKQTGIPWLADFRDPWTNIDYYKDLKLTHWANRRHHQLEKQVLNYADAVVTVGPTMTKEFEEMGCKKVYTLTNGYDAQENGAVAQIPSLFSIVHIGSMPASRNPEMLWPVLAELLTELPGLKNLLSVELIGKVDYSILKAIEAHNLTTYLKQTDHMANSAAIEKMRNSALLLLVINNSQNSKGILTNKFFEYLSVNRPILAIGPGDGDVAAILGQTNSGNIVEFGDKQNLKNSIREFFDAFQNKTLLNSDNRGIEKYSRKNLTQQLSQILSEITE